MELSNKKSILLTIDLEDWFQVENFKPWIPFSSWSSYELRVEKNTYRLLDIFDSIKIATSNNENRALRATFFVLGWIAKRLPHLVKEIFARGHEVASHGYFHNLCKYQTYKDLKKDLTDSKKLLEDIIGFQVMGYRAPSFSIDNDVLKVIQESGFRYDSSYNSFRLNGRYGRLNFSPIGNKGVAIKIANDFYELPISNLTFGKFTFPLGGGGYFRLLPFAVFKIGVNAILKKKNAYIFYMHPWEIDPDQPRLKQASSLFKFRHYLNLDKTILKLFTLIETSTDCHFLTCQKYLEDTIIDNYS